MTEPQVFVSYAHEDRNLRDALVAELARQAGIQVWSDERLETGVSFNEAIAHALYTSRAMVLISSGYSTTSEYVEAEVTFARKLGKRICEVSVAGNCHPDLTDIQRVEFRYGDEEWPDIVAELVPGLRQSLGPSAIFIAHDHAGDAAEKDVVDWVVRELAAQGLGVWYEPDRIEFGDDREAKVVEAIDRSGVVLAVLTERSAGSDRFSQHVGRALAQDDEVLMLVHQAGGASRPALIDAWRETVRRVEGPRFDKIVGARFEKVARLEPVVFTDDERSAQLLAQVANGLRKRQEKFRPDEKVEAEVARVFKEFMATMRETGLDAAAVLSLPQFKVDAIEGASALPPPAPVAGPGAGDMPAPLPPPVATMAPPTTPTIPQPVEPVAPVAPSAPAMPAGRSKVKAWWLVGAAAVVAAVVVVAVVLATRGGDGTGTQVEVPVGEMKRGACYDFNTTLVEVGCGQPHDLEAIDIIDASSEFALDPATYPGDARLETLAAGHCVAQFEAYVGKAPADSEIDAGTDWPAADDWDAGYRRIRCWLRATTEPLVGSMRGANR